MKRIILILGLLLPFITNAQITKNQVKTVISQRLAGQVRLSDTQAVFNLLADYAAQADSTATANAGNPGGPSGPIAISGVTGLQSALDALQPKLAYVPVNSQAPQDNPSYIASLAKSKVGLSLVDNTPDATKPISGPTQTALNGKEPIIPTGTAGQYIRGDKQLATFPALPNANDYITAATDQTLTGGNKTIGGTWNFGNITFSNSFLPGTHLLQSLGNSSRYFKQVYSGFYGINGNSVFGTESTTGNIFFRLGAEGRHTAHFSPAGNLHLYAPGATVTEKGAKLSVDGTSRLYGGIYINPDSIRTFASNEAAVAAGVTPGKLYKTIVDDEWVLKIAHTSINAPLYNELLLNNNTRTFWVGTPLAQQYQVHSPGETWNINKATNRTAPTLRFEVRKGDNWPSDLPPEGEPISAGNDQNGQIKERAELYAKNSGGLEFGKDIWLSYSIKIGGGPDITYTNTDYRCIVGQWHQTAPSGGPPFCIEISGQNVLTFVTKGLDANGETVDQDTAHISRDEWHHIVIRARFSKTANTAQLQWWVDKREIINNNALTMGYSGDATPGYWKFGIYRTPFAVNNLQNLVVEYANMELLMDPSNSNTVNSGTLKGRIDNKLPLTP